MIRVSEPLGRRPREAEVVLGARPEQARQGFVGIANLSWSGNGLTSTQAPLDANHILAVGMIASTRVWPSVPSV